jgi:murein DD-endopeptidase MepM/ murein hydrolase activator NlpD
MNRTVTLTLGFAALGAAAAGVMAMAAKYALPPPPAVLAPPPPPVSLEHGPPMLFLPIRNGDNLDTLLESAGVEKSAKVKMIAAVTNAFNVRKFRAGSHITVTRARSGEFESLEYAIDPDHRLELSASGDKYTAVVVDVPGTIRPVAVCTSLESSLFESVERAGENPELALRMANIFAWDIDFYTDPQEGDQFCILVEKKVYDNGQPATYRRVLAARYVNAGKLFDAYLFAGDGGKASYYSRDGRALQAAFLKSPMKFEAPVSSHFSRRRFHPVLKIYRPHLGTDYAAPTGTPVQAVAAGVVAFSGYGRGEGNWVRLRHSNGYETSYLHLSRRFVGTGDKVEQGEKIGLVGATGLATGAHLDFRVRRNGTFVNFESLDLPRAAEVAANRKAEFAAERDHYRAMMDGESPARAVVASAAAPAADKN